MTATDRLAEIADLCAELRGWSESDMLTDDANRKIWLMHKAADALAERDKRIADQDAKIAALYRLQSEAVKVLGTEFSSRPLHVDLTEKLAELEASRPPCWPHKITKCTSLPGIVLDFDSQSTCNAFCRWVEGR